MPPDGSPKDDTITKNTAIKCANTVNSYNCQVVAKDAIQSKINGYIPVSKIYERSIDKMSEDSLEIQSVRKQMDCIKSVICLLNTQIETMELEISKLTKS